VLIATHSAGYVPQGYPPKRYTLTGTYTPTVTGLHTLEIFNYRYKEKDDYFNYIDNISLVPRNPDFYIETPNISVATGGNVQLTLDADVSHAGEDYFVLMSSGSAPGLTLNGVHIPLNWDAYFTFSKNMANGLIFQNTRDVLDASGQAIATFNTNGAVNAIHLGRHYTFAYVLTDGPGKPPVTYASFPVLVNFIP
jgi:hypothetical protein